MTSAQPEADAAEYLAAEHMQKVGFRGAKRTTTGPDGGVDVEAPTAIAQVKHLRSPVGRPAIQQLLGAGGRSTSRLFYSAGGYSRPALELADNEGIALFTYDLASRKVVPVGETASRLERASDYPGAEPGVLEQPSAPAPQAIPADRVAPIQRPPTATTYAVLGRAVQERPEPSSLHWYFYVACFSGGVLAWIGFLHAFLETRNRYWLGWTLGTGAWGFAMIITASALSGAVDGGAGPSSGQRVLGLILLATLGGICVWLAAARRQALGYETPIPLAGRFGSRMSQARAADQPASPIPASPAAMSPQPAAGYFDPISPQQQPSRPELIIEGRTWWEKPGLGRHIGSYVWAASPFLMVSFGTPITFLVSAILRPRRWDFWLYFVYYLGLFVCSLITTTMGPGWLFGLIVALEWLGATGHAFLIRRQVWYRPRRARIEESRPVLTESGLHACRLAGYSSPGTPG
ncbi:restriction endonuclease [Glycomyces paridis]|nr:restriction endonuclease [Glycomyces paridis]